MRILFISFLLAGSLWADLEAPRCYQLGGEAGFVIINPEPDRYALFLGFFGYPLKLNSRAKCMDCNKDVFEVIDHPKMQVIFNGKRSNESDPYSESGTVAFANVFYLTSYVRVKCPNDENNEM